MNLTKRLHIFALFGAAYFAVFAQISFQNVSQQVIEITPSSSTGLTAVYVLPDASGVRIAYNSSTPGASHRWQHFDNRGGGYAQPISNSFNGNESSIELQETDGGYIVTPYEGAPQICFWVVNYANHECVLNSLESAPEQDCGQQRLALDGNAQRIIYYSINGRGETLSRELQLCYNTLSIDEETRQWVRVAADEVLDYVNGDIICAGPLCDTEFQLTGDRFQQQWGREHSVSTGYIAAHSVDAATWADQMTRDSDNEIKNGDEGSGDSLGGSAPVEISFSAAVTDAAVYREWQFASDTEFEYIDMRVNDLEVARTFEDYGTVYARFICGNNDGSCEYVSQTYAINIGESRLECPNAFSPGASEGVNDEWKVSYKSITRFECHIFNRWGVEIARLTDPSQGWNGRYNGKLVPSGVYYYVITARGADGKNYKLSGDINIIGYKVTQGVAAPTE